MFFNTYSKYSGISDTEYDPSGNSNSSFHVGADILTLRSDKATYLSLHLSLQFILSERLSNSL